MYGMSRCNGWQRATHVKLKDFFTAEAQRRKENLFIITAPAAQLIKNSASPRLCGENSLIKILHTGVEAWIYKS
jgi:hypothetical protein